MEKTGTARSRRFSWYNGGSVIEASTSDEPHFRIEKMPVFIFWTHLVPGSESIPRWHYYATYQDAYPLPKQNDMLGPWKAGDIQLTRCHQRVLRQHVTPHRGHEQLTVATIELTICHRCISNYIDLEQSEHWKGCYPGVRVPEHTNDILRSQFALTHLPWNTEATIMAASFDERDNKRKGMLSRIDVEESFARRH